MIVKKMPILQGFPDFETVKNLSRRAGEFSEFFPVFYDIETTGLSGNTSYVYLIGAVIPEESHWSLCQWFARSRQEEPEILTAFGEFLKPSGCTVQYNGDTFDRPFLTARYKAHGLAEPFGTSPSIDLYRQLKCCRELFSLPGMKQPDLEALLGMPPRKYCDGREGIRRYKDYVKNPLPQTLEEVLGHNREDLAGLVNIFRLLSCLALFQGDFRPVRAEFQGEELLAILELPEELPAELSVSLPGFHLRGAKKEIRLLITGKDGKLQRFYENYRDYAYLPGEDMAIPKVLCASMAKNLYVPARKETCYTWFPVSHRFLSDPRQQKEYFKSVLIYYLKK